MHYSYFLDTSTLLIQNTEALFPRKLAWKTAATSLEPLWGWFSWYAHSRYLLCRFHQEACSPSHNKLQGLSTRKMHSLMAIVHVTPLQASFVWQIIKSQHKIRNMWHFPGIVPAGQKFPEYFRCWFYSWFLLQLILVRYMTCCWFLLLLNSRKWTQQGSFNDRFMRSHLTNHMRFIINEKGSALH